MSGRFPRILFVAVSLLLDRACPIILVTVTRKIAPMPTVKKHPVRRPAGSPTGRWRLQDAKARFSEVVREAQQRGPQRVTLHGKDAVVIVGADEFDRLQSPVSGRDIVTALAASPLADVRFDRLTIKSKVRSINL
jgi:prevent-host-death family protein